MMNNGSAYLSQADISGGPGYRGEFLMARNESKISVGMNGRAG